MKFFLGFVIGAILASTVLLLKKEKPVRTDVQEKLQTFVDTDLKAYAQLKTAEEKLKKADELYQKIMLIFLADLSLKISQEDLKSIPVGELEKVDTGDTPEEPQQDIVTTPEISEKITESVEPKTEIKKNPPNHQEKYLKWKIASSARTMTPEIRRIQGEFKGILSISHGENKGRTDSIYMQINFQQKGKELVGTFLMEMTDPSGKKYNRSRGNGENHQIKIDPNNKDILYIEPAPNDVIVFDMKAYPNLVGQYLEEKGPLGKVRLWKE